jgi:hypothetical protein
MHAPFCRLSWLLALASLGACATRVAVQSVGSADGASIYELRGHHLASLHERARVLCPQGYAVYRQWQHQHPTDTHAGLPAKALMLANDVLSPHGEDEAQLGVQCAPSAPPEPVTSAVR